MSPQKKKNLLYSVKKKTSIENLIEDISAALLELGPFMPRMIIFCRQYDVLLCRDYCIFLPKSLPTLLLHLIWQGIQGVPKQGLRRKSLVPWMEIYVLVIVRKSSCTRYNGTRGGVEIVIQYEAQPSTVWSIETRHECHYIQYSLISVL